MKKKNEGAFSLDHMKVKGALWLDEDKLPKGKFVILLSSKKHKYYWYLRNENMDLEFLRAYSFRPNSRNRNLGNGMILSETKASSVLKKLLKLLPSGMEAHAVNVRDFYVRGYVVEDIDSHFYEGGKGLPIKKTWVMGRDREQAYGSLEEAKKKAVVKVEEYLKQTREGLKEALKDFEQEKKDFEQNLRDGERLLNALEPVALKFIEDLAKDEAL